MFELYGISSYTMFFWMGKRRESLGELDELCDNSSYNCSIYAEFTVCFYIFFTKYNFFTKYIKK